LADKLQISVNSAQLAVQLLDVTMLKDTTLVNKLQLFAPICLLLAAKTIELDERIPFIPKLRKYANTSFSIEDYRKAELTVLDIVDWNPQFTSYIELLEFYQSQGVLFSSDESEELIPQSNGLSSPKALRENSQHANIGGNKSGEKKYYGALSPNSKENIPAENNSSTSITDNIQSNLASVLSNLKFSSLHSSANKLQKQNSMPVYLEEKKGSYSVQKVALNEKRVREILAFFDSNYVKLSKMLVRDSEFIEFEPRVVASASVAFLRSMSRVAPLW